MMTSMERTPLGQMCQTTVNREASLKDFRLHSFEVTPFQRIAWEAIITDLRARNEGKITHIVKEMPRLGDMEKPVFLGSFSWVTADHSERWILEPYAYLIDGLVLTPSELTRAYLRWKFPKFRGRVTRSQYQEVIAKHRSHPLYAKPCTLNEGTYIDIKSAYWSIVQAVGWNVDYHPEMWLGQGADMSDFPFAFIKLSRNCLVSTCVPSTSNMWDGKKLVQVKGSKGHLNVMLHSLVMDVLHGVTQDMILRAGAVYTHTDGHIVPTDRLPDAENVMRSWGLPFTVKGQGKTIVHGVGNYTMPHHHPRLRWSRELPINNIREQDVDWLRAKFRWCAARRLR